MEALRQPFRIQGRDLRVTASGGVGLYPEDGDDAEALVKNADTAMYRAKERGRDNFQLFSPAMAARAIEREAPSSQQPSRRPREEGDDAPLPALPRSRHGRIVGVEALLRWRRPELGLVMPKDFIALADFTGVILSMGPWVLETGLQRSSGPGTSAGRRELWMAVNLSAFELQQPDLAGPRREGARP